MPPPEYPGETISRARAAYLNLHRPAEEHLMRVASADIRECGWHQQNFEKTTKISTLIAELRALRQLYNVTGGPQGAWLNNTGWRGGATLARLLVALLRLYASLMSVTAARPAHRHLGGAGTAGRRGSAQGASAPSVRDAGMAVAAGGAFEQAIDSPCCAVWCSSVWRG